MHYFLRIATRGFFLLLLSAHASIAYDNWGGHGYGGGYGGGGGPYHQNGGGGGQYHQNNAGAWQQGHWSHGPYNGRSGWWWVSGGQYYYYPAPVYPYPAYVPGAVVAQPGYPQAQYWYCANPPGYYPAVPGCYVGWQAVAAPPTQVVTAPQQSQNAEPPVPSYAQPYQPPQDAQPAPTQQSAPMTDATPPAAQQEPMADSSSPTEQQAPIILPAQPPTPSTVQAAPVVPVETASADPAAASSAAPSVPSASVSPQDQDKNQFELFSSELTSISLDEDGSADHLTDLQKRVKAFRQSLFERDYNAMALLKNTEELEKKIAEKQSELGV